MSTRVQKGNTVFRPVTKARARFGSEARQTSAVSEGHPPNGSRANTSMPPPATFPRLPSSRLSTEEPLSNIAQHHTHDTHPSNMSPSTPAALPSASLISVPTRHTTRPPAVQPLTLASRSSTPMHPRIPPGAPKGDFTPMSKPLRESSSNLESHTTTSHLTSEAGHTHVDPLPASVLLPNPTDPPLDSVTAISDAQIDPALLEAVVTVLQHVNQSEAQSSQPLGQQTLASSQSIIQESDLSSRPVPRKRRSKLGPGEAGPSKTSGSGAGSRKTTRYASKPEAEQAAERSEEDDGYPKQRKRTKRVSDSSGSTRKRRSRAPSVPAYDADADPGEELDPTAVTMADLCDDTGRGRVSSKAVQIMTNHTAWRAANREKRARMRMLMEAKKYGRGAEEEENAQAQDTNPTETPAEGQSGNQAIAGPPSPRAHSVEAGTTEGQQGDDFDYTQAMATSRYNVQVRIGPNGETIIDETSLFVDRQEEDETANYTHIEESDATKFVNSMTYSKKLRGSRWSAEETELFFDALSQFGENYELISYVLPGRDRKACKNKFKAEDKRNPNRVTYCLNNQRPYDMQTLARMTGKDFSGPPPEICAPTPLRMPHDTDTRQEGDSAPIQKEGATPAPDEAEVIGEVGILGEHEA